MGCASSSDVAGDSACAQPRADQDRDGLTALESTSLQLESLNALAPAHQPDQQPSEVPVAPVLRPTATARPPLAPRKRESPGPKSTSPTAAPKKDKHRPHGHRHSQLRPALASEGATRVVYPRDPAYLAAASSMLDAFQASVSTEAPSASDGNPLQLSADSLQA